MPSTRWLKSLCCLLLILCPFSGGSYTFEDILPGKYQITVDRNEWCWESSTQTVSVSTAESAVPPFKQVGYIVTFISSHETQVKYDCYIAKTINTFAAKEINK
jgi:hypothetical protein